MPDLALVFGHSSGLGFAIAEILLAEGRRVVGISRSLSRFGGRLEGEIQADLSQRDDVYRVVDTIRSAYADFSTLIYSAGTLAAHPIDKIEYATIESVFRVNLFAPMVIESGVFDLIRENPADVVNVTSSSIVQYYPLFAEYSASKIALAKFSSDLQRALQDSDARVVDICPSGFASALYQRMEGVKVPRDETIQMPTSELAQLVVSILNLPRSMEVTRIDINRKVQETAASTSPDRPLGSAARAPNGD